MSAEHKVRLPAIGFGNPPQRVSDAADDGLDVRGCSQYSVTSVEVIDATPRAASTRSHSLTLEPVVVFEKWGYSGSSTTRRIPSFTIWSTVASVSGCQYRIAT